MAVAPTERHQATCSASCGVGEGGETAGAIDAARVAAAAEQVAERNVEQPGLQVPPGDVDRAEGLHEQTAGAEVAPGAVHRLPAGGDGVSDVAPVDDAGEMMVDHGGGGGGGVGPAQPGLAAGMQGRP